MHQDRRKDTGLCVRASGGVRPFPRFGRPQPVGYFSINTDRDYEPNDQQLRYYVPPSDEQYPLDLNAGLALAIKKPESAYDGSLDSLLKFIYDHRQKILNASSELPEFVCQRGLLRRIMGSPYEYRQDWCVHVTRFGNIFYLRKCDTDQDKFQRAQETERQQAMSAWGFKFEQYCLSESPFKRPCTSAPVDERAEFSCVFKTRLGGFKLLYAAEMDGILSDQPVQLDGDGTNLESLKFVELKVRQEHLNPNQYQTFLRHKTRNWWCQSFLVGIEDIFVGMRTEKGFVRNIEHMKINSLLTMGSHNHWSPSVCANFLLEFLTYLKEILSDENCPFTVYEFCFNSNTGRIAYECFKGKTQYSFLPDWYIALFSRQGLA